MNSIRRDGPPPWAWNAALVLLLLFAALLRCQHVKADPPRILPAVSGSAGIYFDEGIYCHNARNRILFGRWITDEWNPLVYNAPLTAVYFLAFKLFGISIVTVKAVNIVFGLLAILLFHAGVQRYLARGAALALTALFAFDFVFLMYNRLGLLENFSALCLLLGFYLFVLAEERRWPAFALGVTAAMAALSKYLFAYFLLSTLAAVAWRAWRRSRFSELLLFLAGVLATALPWFLGIYLPFRATFRKIGSGWGMLSLPRSPAAALHNLLANPLPRYLQLLPAAGLLLVLFLGWALLKLLRGRDREGPCGLDVFVFLWIAGAFLSMGLLSYRPLRYYLPMVPALYLAASLLLRDREWLRSRFRRFALLAAISALPFLPFYGPPASPAHSAGALPPPLRLGTVIVLAAALVLLLAPGKGARRAAAATAFAVMLGISLYRYAAHFYLHPSFRLEAASRYMENLPAGSVVLGQEAPRLTLGTRFQAVMAYENWFNDEDPFGRFAPDYVLALDRFRDAELGWMRRRFPERVAALRLVRRFPVWDTTVSLYRVRK